MSHLRALSLFGEGARFHHVGLGVASIAEVCPGAEVHHETAQRVGLAFTRIDGLPVELLEAAGERSPIARSVQDGPRLLHLCYEVPDLEAALAACRAHGLHRLGPPVPTEVFQGRRVVWVYGKLLGLFELLEE
ncbi:MAG: VOC family protein [Planctomycetes bacterium]|nr:VOC family protein [Planctomycetota bacterium]